MSGLRLKRNLRVGDQNGGMKFVDRARGGHCRSCGGFSVITLIGVGGNARCLLAFFARVHAHDNVRLGGRVDDLKRARLSKERLPQIERGISRAVGGSLAGDVMVDAGVFLCRFGFCNVCAC